MSEASGKLGTVLRSQVVVCSASSVPLAGDDIIGIDLGTTNSCVSVMEGKVGSVGGS